MFVSILVSLLRVLLTSGWSVALEISWKSAAILAVAWAVSLLLRRAPAALRHAVWVLALGSLLLLPALLVLLPAWRPAALSGVLSGARAGISTTEGVESQQYTGLQSTLRSTLPLTSPAPQPSPQPWRIAVFALWMAGAGICLLRRRNGTRQVARLRRSAVPPEQAVSGLALESATELHLRRPVTLLIGDDAIVPMVTGVLRPAVLLPREAARWSHERLHIVLLHEMAHIRRRDCVTQALAELAGSLYWFNPLVWLAIRRLRIERERACDDLVLSVGNKASDYAAHLLALARPLETGELAAAAETMANSSHLETRLRSILNPQLDRRALTRVAGVTALVIAACLVLPLAAMRPQASDARTVSGAVFDAAGAVVPEASIVLNNADTGQTQTTSTGPDGQFSIGPLADGMYRLEVDARGFAPAIRRLKVDGQHPLRLDITVDLGDVHETVVVRVADPRWSARPHRIRVGGNVTPASSSIRPTRSIRRQVSRQGDVVASGCEFRWRRKRRAACRASAPVARAAMNAVRQWRYEPALLNGQPIETDTTITVNFQLEP
jgi:beta-lactamase regulating signal transducer with metallopeptidase domain